MHDVECAEEILLVARIVRRCDAYGAIANDRSYRPAPRSIGTEPRFRRTSAVSSRWSPSAPGDAAETRRSRERC
jgi:hypothetical protein